MSLLWSDKRNMKLLTKKLRPSPTNQTDLKDSARNPEIFHDGGKDYRFIMCSFIEGISLFISFYRKKIVRSSDWVCAGMTVEATIVLPLFLFFFFNMGCAIEMIRFHGNVQLGLWKIGNEISLYGYALDSGEIPEEEHEDSWWKGMAGMVFSSTYVKWRLIDDMGKEYINQAPLSDGADSIHLWESDIFGSEDEVDIVVTYSVSPWSQLIGFVPFRMANRYHSHIWNGYELPKDAAEGIKTVFIAENGTVYHLRRDCTYIQLHVRKIWANALGNNGYYQGRQYKPCVKCTGGKVPVEVYITQKGNCYHYLKECPGLKRTVYAVNLKNLKGYRLCSRCGKSGGA